MNWWKSWKEQRQRKAALKAWNTLGARQSMLWTTKANGERVRVFCKRCLFEGRNWLDPNPCEHILEAEGETCEIETARHELSELDSQVNGDPK